VYKNMLHFLSLFHFDFTAHLDLIKHSLSSGREIFPEIKSDRDISYF